MKLLRSELISEFNHKLFDMSARDLPDRGTVFSDNSILCELSVKIVQFGFQISGELKVTPAYECVRCLESSSDQLTLPFKLWLTATKEKTAEDQDLIYFPDSQDHFEMNEPIADIISLAEPINPVCNKQCKGLCPNCGTNLNQASCDCILDEQNNPWDALKNFKPE